MNALVRIAPVLDRSVFYCAWCADETLSCDCNSLPTYEEVRDAYPNKETLDARNQTA